MQAIRTSSGAQLVLPVCLALTLLVGANVLFLQGNRSQISDASVSDTSPAPAATRVKSTKVKPKPVMAPAAARPDAIAALLAADQAPTEVIAGVATNAMTPAVPAFTADPELVLMLQRGLNDAGYQAGAETGVAGLMTRGAILAYEHDRGLPLTAEPSQAVLDAVSLGQPAAVKKMISKQVPGLRATALIKSAQALLRKLGYRTGLEQGTLNDQTARAIRQFESASGLPPTGRVSGALLAELSRMSGTRLDVAAEQ